MTEFYQFYPNVVALIGSKHGGKANLMPAVWQTGVSKDPMVYVVSISPKRFTHGLIKSSGAFSANFVDFRLVKTLVELGSCSGRDRDKIRENNIVLKPSRCLEVPIMKEAYAAFECSVLDIVSAGDHDLFIGKVVSVHESESTQTSSGTIDCSTVKPVLYLGSDRYMTVDPDSSIVIKRSPK